MTRSDEAYRVLHGMLVEGEMRPNQRIVESEVADRLGVSRTPLREALQRLRDEGMVDTTPHGWVVHEHTAEEVRALFEVRVALEGFAARLAAERATPAELQALAGIHEQAVDAVRESGDSGDLPLDQFHHRLGDLSRNALLVKELRRNGKRYFERVAARFSTREDRERTLDDHERVLAALQDRDAREAERAARSHLLDSLEMVLERLP